MRWQSTAFACCHLKNRQLCVQQTRPVRPYSKPTQSLRQHICRVCHAIGHKILNALLRSAMGIWRPSVDNSRYSDELFQFLLIHYMNIIAIFLDIDDENTFVIKILLGSLPISVDCGITSSYRDFTS
jgi:hypothetical protein